MAEDRYDKPRIADDYPAINRRMKELQLGGSVTGFALPPGVSILTAGEARSKIALDKELILIFHLGIPSKLVVFHYDNQEIAARKMHDLTQLLVHHFPSTKRSNSEIQMSRDDGLDLLARLRK